MKWKRIHTDGIKNWVFLCPECKVKAEKKVKSKAFQFVNVWNVPICDRKDCYIIAKWAMDYPKDKKERKK